MNFKTMGESVYNGFNRYIVECKFVIVFLDNIRYVDLIDT